MHLCTNHPHTTARAGCGQCARPFCDACLVPFQGALLCGACRNAILARMQGAGQQVYTPARRQTMAATATFLLLGLLFGPMLLGLLLSAGVGTLAPRFAVIPMAAGLVLGFGGMFFLATPLSQLGAGKLREDVTRKLQAGGLTSEFLQQGMFVGIAPGELLRSYHGDLHWDVGYLLAGPGWLAYYGDQTHFSLRPDQITALEINPAKGNATFTVCRLMIRWRDERAQLSGVMNVMAQSFKSRKEARAQLETLRGRLEAWRVQPVTTPVSAGWPLPPVGVPGGNQLATVAAEPGGWWRQLVVGLALAIPLGVVAGLAKRLGNVDIPVAAIVAPTVAGSMILGAKWNRLAAERKAQERLQAEARTDGGATTFRT